MKKKVFLRVEGKGGEFLAGLLPDAEFAILRLDEGVVSFLIKPSNFDFEIKKVTKYDQFCRLKTFWNLNLQNILYLLGRRLLGFKAFFVVDLSDLFFQTYMHSKTKIWRRKNIFWLKFRVEKMFLSLNLKIWTTKSFFKPHPRLCESWCTRCRCVRNPSKPACWNLIEFLIFTRKDDSFVELLLVGMRLADISRSAHHFSNSTFWSFEHIQ